MQSRKESEKNFRLSHNSKKYRKRLWLRRLRPPLPRNSSLVKISFPSRPARPSRNYRNIPQLLTTKPSCPVALLRIACASPSPHPVLPAPRETLTNLQPIPTSLLSWNTPSMDHPTSLENGVLINLIQLVSNIINARRLKKILAEQSGSRSKAKPKKVNISKRIVEKLLVQP